ncbi:hypothetical protein PENTCL1PPCAC_22563, partial [Pristionchus entomophagus]
MDPPMRHLPLRFTRHIPLPKYENTHPLDLLDVSSTNLFFHYPHSPSHSIIIMDIESETLSEPISLPIPDQFEIEHFRMLDPITAVTILLDTREYGRRVAILRSSDSRWESIQLLTMMDKEWIRKQELSLLTNFNQSTFYIHTFYRANLNEDKVGLLRMGSVDVNDDTEAQYSQFTSLFPDRIIMVKTLYDIDSLIGGGRGSYTSLEGLEEYKAYILQSMYMKVYTMDLVTQLIEEKNLDVVFPPNLHVLTETTTVDMIENQLAFSQPGGCIIYNIDEETYTKYTIDDSCREYRVKSSMGRNGLLGLTNNGDLFRGYLKIVPSLHEMTHSIIRTLIPSIPSKDLTLSNTHSLIRSLY